MLPHLFILQYDPQIYHLININKHHKENSFLKIALMLLQVLI